MSSLRVRKGQWKDVGFIILRRALTSSVFIPWQSNILWESNIRMYEFQLSLFQLCKSQQIIFSGLPFPHLKIKIIILAHKIIHEN